MNSLPKKILIIDDDVDICFLLSEFLKGHGFEVQYSFQALGGIKLLKDDRFDLVLVDFRLPDMEGIKLLQKIKQLHPDLPAIVITGYSDVRTAVNVIKHGAYDYVTKPILPDEILEKVKEAMDKQEQPQNEAPAAKPAPVTTGTSPYLTGESPASQQLQNYLELVGPTNMTVILHGETGAGKEVAARTIHQLSQRQGKPFLALDCGALTEEIAASELFGHKKGSFTGALQDKDGFFIKANGGTLFLDEIGNLSYEIQVQLLRVLQEKKVRRLGETTPQEVDVRLIVASNDDLREAAREGRFREDLFHRLNEFQVSIPALRERGNDVQLFANHFLSLANQALNKEVAGFSEKAKEVIHTYDWPGNMREMKNVIKRAVLLCQSRHLSEGNFPEEIVHYNPGLTGTNAESELKSATEQAEYEVILKALQDNKFNKTQTAKMLGIDRKTLYNKMKQLNIN